MRLSTSYIICTKNRPDDLRRCIRSIVKQTILPNELIIVDAGRIKNIKEDVEDILTNTKIPLLYIHTEPGLTRQRNIGIDHAKEDIIFFLDDDVVVYREYNEEMLNVYRLKGDNRIGGVEGTITNDPIPNPLLDIFRRVFLLSNNIIDGKGGVLPSGNAVFVCRPSRIIPVEIMNGCGSYKREIFQDLRFDEYLSGYALNEDVEFSYRVSRRYKLYKTPYAKVIHKRTGVNRIDQEEYSKMRVVNYHYFFKKNMPQRVKNKMAYLWSQIGFIILAIIQTIRHYRDLRFQLIIGIIKGYMKVLKGKITI
ncbi:MAG: glycosyltransferase family 2 protein [Nitrospinae bacterium]|nr:glycosyltransferase family 2 protein [Nitrospinota bacterium]